MFQSISQILDEIAAVMADPAVLEQTGKEAERQVEERSDAGTLDPEQARMYWRMVDSANPPPED